MEYVVRFWVDFKVRANSVAEAKEIADRNFDKVDYTTEGEKVEYYDAQLAQVWEKESSIAVPAPGDDDSFEAGEGLFTEDIDDYINEDGKGFIHDTWEEHKGEK